MGATQKASSAFPGGYSLHNICNKVEAHRKRLVNVEELKGASTLVKSVLELQASGARTATPTPFEHPTPRVT